MSGHGHGPGRPQRVRQRHVEWVAERLTDRDRKILLDLGRVRLLTGHQIERLQFHDLTGRSRSVMRWRVLKRLTDWGVLLPLPRRIGGASGSAAMAYAVDSTGTALLRLWATPTNNPAAVRRPGLPGDRFVRHVLGVSELYVGLVEATRPGGVELVDFQAEPDAWMPNGLGGWLKPDAYVVLASGEIEDHWAVEVDKATEHLPTLRRKFDTYLDFRERGETGPHGVMPRVLVTVPDELRLRAVTTLVGRLPAPSKALFFVVHEDDAPRFLLEVLRE